MPHFKTLADFRRDNGPAIQAACAQFVVLCRRLKLFSQAVASRSDRRAEGDEMDHYRHLTACLDCALKPRCTPAENLICFTTGRGSAFGAKPAPSLKLATNSDIYRKMEDDMDIDCGTILDGVPVEEKGREISDRLQAVASGAPTKSEDLGYGDAEFVPWQIGAVM